MADNPVAGHMTLRREDGSLYHLPLHKDEADELLKQVEESERRRKELMPTEESAREMFFDAWLRLREFGWREAAYCPKDGSAFDCIEPGSTGVHTCAYEGEWPDGGWWVYEDGDSAPSHPALWRAKKEEPTHG